MKAVGKVFDSIEHVIKMFCGILVAGFTGTTLVAVVARYVFSAPIWWSEQFCRYLFIWMLMLYLPIIMRHGQNLGFDLFKKVLPKNVQDIMQLLCEMLICAFGALYCYYSMELCLKFANKMMEGIHIPAPVMYSSQVVGAGFLCLFTLEVTVNHIIDICHRRMEGEEK